MGEIKYQDAEERISLKDYLRPYKVYKIVFII